VHDLLVAEREPLILPGLIKRDGIVLPQSHLDVMSIYPVISGGARGFNQVGDVVFTTADGRDLNQIWADYQAALASYNQQRDRLMAVLTFPVTVIIEDVFQGGDVVDFERASEYGEPRGIRAALPTYFSLGYSFYWWDLAVRYTWMFLAEATTEQVDSLNNAAMEGDNRLQFTEVMKQIFNNVTRTATIRGQNYNVYPLYNGDSTVPPRYKSTVHTSGHQHFLSSGAATVDPGDLTGSGSMYEHLSHHGYSWQEGSQLILMANSAQTATIKTFRFGVNGAEYDFIPSQAVPSWVIPHDLQQSLTFVPGAIPPGTINGLPVIGRYGPWLIVEDDQIPAGYMLGFASGGNLNASNLVGIREHPNTSLRGLRLVKGPDADYPLIDSFYQRGFGTGIRQRGAGVVMKIGAGGYTIPTGFTW
jgi:hypothetical protein